MTHHSTIAIDDICRDAAGLLVRVEDVDVYDYVHFAVIDNGEAVREEADSGEMTHIAFDHRFTKVGNFSHI